MKHLFGFLTFFYFTNFFAQVGGASVYQFLNLSSSARQIALGGETLTIMDDVNQPIWNPSVINSEMDNKISVNYSSFLAGVNIGSVSYAKTLSRRFGTLHASIKYLDYGSMIAANEFGVETGNFSANDSAISVGYAYSIPRSNIAIGANLKLINATISNFTSFGTAIDFAILYYSEFQPLSMSLVVRNLGTQLKSFNGVQEKMPLKVALGVSYRLQYVPIKWYGTLDNLQQWDISVANPSNQTVDLEGNVTKEDINFLNNMFRHIIVGAELFPDNLINIRAGYNFKRARELALQNVRTFSGVSLGFGVKMNKFKFNYAYSKFHAAANASTFSLLINLDRR